MKALKDLMMQNVAKVFGLVGGVLVMVGLMLIGCTPDTTAPTLQSQPTNAPPQTGDVADTFAVSDVMTTVPPFTDTACLNCHTDQAALTELAKPEEETESLSSGPG